MYGCSVLLHTLRNGGFFVCFASLIKHIFLTSISIASSGVESEMEGLVSGRVGFYVQDLSDPPQHLPTKETSKQVVWVRVT